MRAKWLRLAMVAALLAFLVIFFVPFIPQAVSSYSAPCSGLGYCVGGPIAPSGSLNYLSLGYYFVHWGAANTYLGGYTPPTITYTDTGGVSTLSTFGVIGFVMLPVLGVCVALIGFRRLTAVASLSLLGWGLLIMVTSLSQHDAVISEYGYLMAVYSGFGVVATVWGRKIISYWRVDPEPLS